MKVSVIIVHWNTPKELIVQSSKLKVNKDVEIIVVDNNSERTKDLLYCFELLERSKIKIIRNKTNLGFASACNQGAKIAKGEWLLFLNPDTHITALNILEFVDKAKGRNLDAASLQPSSNNYLKPLPTPFSLLVEFSPLRRLIPLSIFKQKTLFGGGLLIKRNVLAKLKGWDKRFFLWFEDSDLTRRLLNNGYKIGWVDIPHTHMGGVSFNRMSDEKRKEIFFTSMNFYSSKHFGFLGKLVVKFLTFLNK